MDQCDEMEQDAVTTLCILLLSYVTKFIVQKGRFIFLNPIACNPSCYFSRTVSTNYCIMCYMTRQGCQKAFRDGQLRVKEFAAKKIYRRFTQIPLKT